jgi:signal transduction histidine kinase
MVQRVLNSKPWVMVVALVFLGLVTAADHLTGSEIVLPVFYLLPVLLVAWRVSFEAAVILSLLAGAATMTDDLLFGHFSRPGIPVWNAAARVSVNIIAGRVVFLLRQVNERLRASEALREDLTNMLVHDLKNPLVAASMALQLYRRRRLAAKDASPQERQEQEQLLDVAGESNERLRRLIEDILDVARAEAGEMPLDREKVDLAEVVRQAVQGAAPALERGDRALAEFYPVEPLTVEIDAAKIRRVVDNLLDNALKYSPPEGHLQVRVEQRDARALVSVHDDGQGIAPEMQHIFDKFGQAEAAHSVRRMSFGLGLAFAKLAVEAHGGSIWVESEPEQGTTFTFSLPLTNLETV